MIQTQKGKKNPKMLIYFDMHIFREIPFGKPQNDT